MTHKSNKMYGAILEGQVRQNRPLRHLIRIWIARNTFERPEGLEIRYIPVIIKFLRYNPRPKPEGVLGKLEWYRWTNGLSIERLGVVMKRDPEQLSDWLSGRHKPFRKSLEKLNGFLK